MVAVLAPTEHQEQVRLIQWTKLEQGKYPELEWLYAIPNAGKRSGRAGAAMVAEGLKKGVPDLCLPEPSRGFHGLYIEMKVGYNKPSEDQKRWLLHLKNKGYYTSVCYSWEQAKDVILWYLDKGEKKDEPDTNTRHGRGARKTIPSTADRLENPDQSKDFREERPRKGSKQGARGLLHRRARRVRAA